MTKLTIKIDENISLTGTIVTEENGTETYDEYDIYYYQPECPWGANCEYAGNVLLPMQSNITSNVSPGIPVPPGWTVPKSAVLGWYHLDKNMTLTGNLSVIGNEHIGGNLNVSGTINGLGSLTNVKMLPDMPVPPAMGWAGNPGEIAIGGNFVYLCVAMDSWVRWPIEKTW